MSDGERLNHPILEQSFAIIDQEIGNHSLNSWEYAIARRVIHTTADFEFAELLRFSTDAIESAIACLRRKVPIITDVGMVKQGITTMVAKTFNNFLIAAVEQVSVADAGKTRTETGILRCFEQYPQGIYVIGNAPTALLALCDRISESNLKPGLIIGAPVGFVSVVESKQALARLSVPQIRVEGRKGGSSVAAAILNALLVLAWENF
ncbi:cobalt-precorrin-8X methylmutase [Hydrococcus rivularis NIES-593]|uniref:Cobalt-precorrin-8X methylmutase n=1 Tax=Hydrococcus rivularis NIES-593 TaxID=1921803 RepID=A0A1U7HI47_9CYAN|nr:cobalt-precorrin-8X methylmutase [Hydrococcus rivularis]OKH23263.1 cobalt-precorrin-8X methylmutase [Hydrococcus rivularis NIES-593]